jgi:hypothetical protein
MMRPKFHAATAAASFFMALYQALAQGDRASYQRDTHSLSVAWPPTNFLWRNEYGEKRRLTPHTELF